MPDTPLKALLRLEAARGWALLRQTLPPIAVIGVVFALLEGGRPEGWGMGLGILAAGQGALPGIRALPDKVDGTVAFLTSLPVDGRLLAQAQILACSAYALLMAPVATVSFFLMAPLPGELAWSPGPLLLTACAFWLGVGALSSLATGVVIRFPVGSLGWVPAVLLLGLMAAGMLGEALWPGLDRRLLVWLLSDAPAWALVGLLVSASAGGLVVAYHLLARGYTRFRPGDGGLPVPEA